MGEGEVKLVQIRITLQPEIHAVLVAWLKAVQGCEGTHGDLTLNSLAAMLLEDVALATTRPGSWEGSSMGELLLKHGYEP